MLLSANEGAVSLSQLGTRDLNFKAREKWCKIILLISVLYKVQYIQTIYQPYCCFRKSYLGPVHSSNGNASETKANGSFDNGVFFDIEAKRTPSIISKLFLNQSKQVQYQEKYFKS